MITAKLLLWMLSILALVSASPCKQSSLRQIDSCFEQSVRKNVGSQIRDSIQKSVAEALTREFDRTFGPGTVFGDKHCFGTAGTNQKNKGRNYLLDPMQERRGQCQYLNGDQPRLEENIPSINCVSQPLPPPSPVFYPIPLIDTDTSPLLPSTDVTAGHPPLQAFSESSELIPILALESHSQAQSPSSLLSVSQPLSPQLSQNITPLTQSSSVIRPLSISTSEMTLSNLTIQNPSDSQGTFLQLSPEIQPSMFQIAWSNRIQDSPDAPLSGVLPLSLSIPHP